MAISPSIKSEVRELYLDGVSCLDISNRLELSLRTVQRWVKEFKEESTVTVTVEPLEATPPLEALRMVAEADGNSPEPLERNGEAIELNLTPRIAARLLNLTEVAISTIEEILTSGDASHGSRLKAVQILSQWVGLGENARSTVMGNVTHKLGLNCSEDYEENQVVFTPRSN